MQAFHNEQAVKDKYLARVKRHRELDNLVQGTGWDGQRGCAVGCCLEAYDHKRYETELGIPEWLARVEDTIFEGLPVEKAMEWPERFLAAINPGADLDKVKAPFLIFVLESTLDTFDHDAYPDVLKAINDVIALYTSGETDSAKFQEAARAAARAARAAWAAARAAAWAAAEAAEAAWAAAWAAAEAAWAAAQAAEAAWAAARAAAWAARATRYEMFSDKLVELLSECKPGTLQERGVE